MKQSRTLLFFLLFISTASQAQWTQTNGLYTIGSIRALATDNQYLYAGIGNNCLTYGEIHRSADGGASWVSIAAGLPVFNMAFDVEVFGNKLFAATYDQLNNVGNGIYVSVNQGNTWTQSDNGLPANSMVTTITANGSILYAIGGGGYATSLYASSDSGATWLLRGAIAANAWSLSFLGNDIYAGTVAGLRKSTDGGATWTTLTNGLPAGGLCLYTFTAGPNVFTSVSYTPNDNGLYVSIDNGASWVVDSVGLLHQYPVESHLIVGNVIYVAAYGVCASYDGGFTWVNTGTTQSGELALDQNYMYVGLEPANDVWRIPRSVMTGENLIPGPEIGIAPNPFSTITTLSFPSPQNNASITICDLSGKIVCDFKCSGLNVQLDRSGMESGLYLLRATDDNGKVSQMKLLVE
jgi:photosystem II stability/assembly factor-like uncharacterized protein